MALPVNQAAKTANTILKQIEGAVSPLIEAEIISAVPELGLPVIKQIVGKIESIIEDKLTSYLETGADFLIFDIQTKTENSALVNARNAYLVALHTGNANAIASARRIYVQAQSAVANDDGSAPVL